MVVDLEVELGDEVNVEDSEEAIIREARKVMMSERGRSRVLEKCEERFHVLLF